MSNSSGYTVISYAAFQNKASAVHAMLDHMKEHEDEHVRKKLVNWINARDFSEVRGNALLFTAFNGNMTLLKRLVEEEGADIKVMGFGNMNVLHMAAQGNQAAVLHYFVTKHGLSLEQKDHNGGTPLLWAAFCASELALSYLVSRDGIDINAKNDRGETALHQAVCSAERLKSTNLIKRLLIKGADITVQDYKGRTPAMFAE